jgi:ribosomal protein S18 acetylase RimI-like enzyme
VDEALTLERECADAWPALVDESLGQWRLRAAGGFTGRANSALPLGAPGVPMSDALTRVVEFAAANGIRPAAHVVVGAPMETDLAAAGWAIDQGRAGGAETIVMTGPLCSGTVPAGATVPDQPPARWWPLAVDASTPSPAQRHVLAGMPGLGFGTLARDGEVVGIVRGAVVGDLLHIARLVVAPTHRRQGLAIGLLAALAEWAGQRGIRRCALQVTTHNEAAISLYAKLRCRPHHRYRYWAPRRLD